MLMAARIFGKAGKLTFGGGYGAPTRPYCLLSDILSSTKVQELPQARREGRTLLFITALRHGRSHLKNVP